MKQKALIVLLSIFSLSAITYADSSDTDSTTPSPHDTKKPPFREYDNRLSFFPTYLSYERIKPNAVYVGMETSGGFPLNKALADLFFYSELRLGYNFFFRGRDHLTPVVGGGYTKDICINHARCLRRPNIGYGLIGLRYWHECSYKFHMGVNAEFLIGRPTNEKHQWNSPVMGFNISVPLIFKFKDHEKWDSCIEPYSVYLRGGNTSTIYAGLRYTLGYRF
jgi:hypothetical protein